MKYNLFSFATWINSDPRRLYFILVVLAVLLMLVALAVPSHVTFAGWAAGGSD